MSPYGIILSIVIMGASVQDGHAYYLIDNHLPVYNPYYYNPYINTYVNSYNHVGPLQSWPNIVQQSPYRYLGPSFYPYFNVQCYIVQHIYLCCAFNIRDLKCIALQELYPKEVDYDYDEGTNGSGDEKETSGETEPEGVTETSGETEPEGVTENSGETENGGVTENSDETGNGGVTENSGETEPEDSTEANGESGEGTPGEPVRRSILLDDRDLFEFE